MEDLSKYLTVVKIPKQEKVSNKDKINLYHIKDKPIKCLETVHQNYIWR